MTKEKLLFHANSNFVSISFPEKKSRIMLSLANNPSNIYTMKERDHIHCKRASDILEGIGGYLMPLNSVKNCFILPTRVS